MKEGAFVLIVAPQYQSRSSITFYEESPRCFFVVLLLSLVSNKLRRLLKVEEVVECSRRFVKSFRARRSEKERKRKEEEKARKVLYSGIYIKKAS